MSNMKKVVVLGAGMVGSVLALDLAQDKDLDILVADVSEGALAGLSENGGLRTLVADLSDPKVLKDSLASADLVVGALPGRYGFQTLEAVIDLGRNYCDISFMPEDAWDLDDRARKAGVTAVVDCGVAPGMSNMFFGAAQTALTQIDKAAIYVGGLPRVRTMPWQYKAPFSPSDVIEEYVRPSRMVENGAVVVKPALSEPELLEFPDVGTLEAFNTDGLRSLIHTVEARTMVEKTMRWPGHRDLILALRETGFFSAQPLSLGSQDVAPLDLSSRLLFKEWTYGPGEEDITVMRVSVTGEDEQGARSFTWDLLDAYDPETGYSSMARTTAFPAAIVARMILNGSFHNPGVHPPEVLGRVPGLLDSVLSQLENRGVVFQISEAKG